MDSSSASSGMLRLAHLLLPVLAVRALVPAGFMPAFDAEHGLTLSICPGAEPAIAQRAASDATRFNDAADASREHHANHGDSDKSGAGNPASHFVPCPFAAASGPTLAHEPPLSVPAVAQVAVVRTDATDQVALPALLRAQSARAPPLPA